MIAAQSKQGIPEVETPDDSDDGMTISLTLHTHPIDFRRFRSTKSADSGKQAQQVSVALCWRG